MIGTMFATKSDPMDVPYIMLWRGSAFNFNTDARLQREAPIVANAPRSCSYYGFGTASFAAS